MIDSVFQNITDEFNCEFQDSLNSSKCMDISRDLDKQDKTDEIEYECHCSWQFFSKIVPCTDCLLN